jgi:hypothetical protein
MARLNYGVSVYNVQASGTQGRIGFNVYSNYVGTPQYRLYLEGGPVPSFTNMILSGSTYTTALGTPPLIDLGLYVLEYKDNNGEVYIGKFEIFDNTAACYYTQDDYVETGSVLTIAVTDSKITL